LNGVDVDGRANGASERPARLIYDDKCLAKRTPKRRPEHESISPATANSRNRRRGGALDQNLPSADGSTCAGAARKNIASIPRIVVIRGVDTYKRSSRKRGIPEFLAVDELTFHEGDNVVASGDRNRRIVGIPRLHDDSPRRIPTAGAPCNLHKKLKCSFVRTKIGNAESCIRIDDSHKSDVRQIVTLGHHLGPDENIDLASLHPSEHAFDLLAGCDVAVESGNARRRKHLRNAGLQAFGSEALEFERVGVTNGARGRKRTGIIAIVAPKHVSSSPM
jgi:hypothetical protein